MCFRLGGCLEVRSGLPPNIRDSKGSVSRIGYRTLMMFQRSFNSCILLLSLVDLSISRGLLDTHLPVQLLNSSLKLPPLFPMIT